MRESEDHVKKIILMFVAAAVVACSGKQDAPPQVAVAVPQMQQVSEVKPAAPVQEATGQLTGTVLESQDAAGYTYVRLKTVDGEKWAAVAQSKVVKGETVKVDVQMMVDNFESKTLNRRFDAIAFGTIAGRATAAPPKLAMKPSGPASMPPRPMTSAAQHMTAPDAPSISVKRAEGKDARTIGELLTSSASLDGQSVTLRGKIVKFNSGIMGKNWIHLRDGSKAGGEDADITVTTDAVAAVGDVVIVKGKVSVDKDFGAGYRYAVIIENANISK